VQFTPDLLPADLTGTLVWENANQGFSLRKGPVFANIVLADEVNRAPAKVQSALLESMEEGQVTIGETSYPLPDPFFVLATQNPIEHEGTYPLPEAELDRFIIKLKVDYPDEKDELAIVTKQVPVNSMDNVLNLDALNVLRDAAAAVHVDEKVAGYMVRIVRATRPLPKREAKRGISAERENIDRYVSFGASVRGSAAIHKTSRIHALFEGRDFVTPDDVKLSAPDALRHRLVLSFEAEAENINADIIIQRILAEIPVP
jgi:MoxR-like ATPase